MSIAVTKVFQFGGRVAKLTVLSAFVDFAWSDDGLLIEGLTLIGRATVVALHLSDDPDVITVRSYWVLAGWHPPTD